MRKLAELQRTFLTHGTQMSILGSFERLMDVSIDNGRAKVHKVQSYPSHVLESQSDGIIAIFLPAVLIYRGRIEDPFVVQILHQTA